VIVTVFFLVFEVFVLVVVFHVVVVVNARSYPS